MCLLMPRIHGILDHVTAIALIVAPFLSLITDYAYSCLAVFDMLETKR